MVQQLQQKLLDDIAACNSAAKKKALLKGLRAGIKALMGAALIYFDFSGITTEAGKELVLTGLKDLFALLKTDTTSFAQNSRFASSAGGLDNLTNTACGAEAAAGCSQSKVADVVGYFRQLKATIGGVYAPESTTLAPQIASYIDQARGLLQNTVSAGGCAQVVSDAADLNEARQLLGQLDGLNLGLFSLVQFNALGEAHAALVMSGGFPSPQLMRMKMDVSFVAVDDFLAQMQATSNLDVFASVRLRELAEQVLAPTPPPVRLLYCLPH